MKEVDEMTDNNMTLHDRTDAVIATAGAGFRLSLVLNAVKMKMQNADPEIQNISRGISDYSLMLKLVAKQMDEGGVQPTPLAVDTVFDIKEHSEHIFEEIKGMTELAQVRDEKGNLTEIGIGQKVVWSFKQQKVPYLLGQLDYLKTNLSIMLQVLQFAKIVSPMKPRPSDKLIMQERAEIQNMIVLQHWSNEALRALLHNANQASRRDSITSSTSEDPPPKYEDPPSDEVRLAIAPPKPAKEEEAGDNTKALVKYQEQPVAQLDDALHSAVSRENNTLNAQVQDIVYHLLQEWTIPEYPSQAPSSHPQQHRGLTNGTSHHRKPKLHQTTVSSDEGDTTESDDDDPSSPRSRGYYLEGNGQPTAPKPIIKKKLRFANQQAHVSSDSDTDDHRKKKTTKHSKHILRNDSSSSESDASPPPSSATTSSKSRDRPRRPYNNIPRNSPPEKETVYSPTSYHPQQQHRGIPPSPRQGPVPISIHQQQQQPYPHHTPTYPPPMNLAHSPNLRPPPPHHHSAPPPQARRMSSSQSNPYIPPQYMPNSPSLAPIHTHHQGYTRERERPSRPKGGHSQNSSYEGKHAVEIDGRRAGSDGGKSDNERRAKEERRVEERKKIKKDASRNIKKGIGIGAAAAGLMELLSGLDAI